MSSGFSPGAPGCTCHRPHYRVHSGSTMWPPPGSQGAEPASWRTARATQGRLLSLRVPSGRRLAPLCIHPAPAGLGNQLWGCLPIKGVACCGLGSGDSVSVCVCTRVCVFLGSQSLARALTNTPLGNWALLRSQTEDPRYSECKQISVC